MPWWAGSSAPRAWTTTTAGRSSRRSRSKSREAPMRSFAAAFAFFIIAAQAGVIEPRPKIGLVLGGGGARGAAHIRILEVLEDNRVPIDCIAGTSMGARVGGAYAAGVSPQGMRESIAKTDWEGIFDDTAGRDLVNLR